MDPWEQLRREIIACERCPRLVAYRQGGQPGLGFGDRSARLLIVGLASLSIPKRDRYNSACYILDGSKM